MNFAWLIEAPGQKYLAVRKLSNMHDFHWTPNHVDALAFRSREQADDTIDGCAPDGENVERRPVRLRGLAWRGESC